MSSKQTFRTRCSCEWNSRFQNDASHNSLLSSEISYIMDFFFLLLDANSTSHFFICLAMSSQYRSAVRSTLRMEQVPYFIIHIILQSTKQILLPEELSSTCAVRQNTRYQLIRRISTRKIPVDFVGVSAFLDNCSVNTLGCFWIKRSTVTHKNRADEKCQISDSHRDFELAHVFCILQTGNWFDSSAFETL